MNYWRIGGQLLIEIFYLYTQEIHTKINQKKQLIISFFE